jgi:hypothetical protein
LIFPQAEFSLFNKNLNPCFQSPYLLKDGEDRYLTNEGVQPRAFKAMIDRAVESKDSTLYDLEAGNINEYNFA